VQLDARLAVDGQHRERLRQRLTGARRREVRGDVHPLLRAARDETFVAHEHDLARREELAAEA